MLLTTSSFLPHSGVLKHNFLVTKGRSWPWPWFLMCVSFEWRSVLAYGLGMYVTAALWFFGIIRLGTKGSKDGWYRLGSGLLLNGFTTGLRDGGAVVMTCCSRQEPHSSRRGWRTWCMGQLGPDIDGIASDKVGLRRAGKGDRPYLTSRGGAGGQQRRQQWRMRWGTGMKRLWPRSAYHRFGVPYQRQLSWIRNKCGATSCSMSGTRTRTDRCGDGAKDAEQRPVCAAVRNLLGTRDPMRQTLVAAQLTRDKQY